MAGSGSPRQKTPVRRMLMIATRIAALFAIIVGVSGALMPALTSNRGFYVVAAVFAITTFFLLNPKRKPIAAEDRVATLTAPIVERLLVVDEAKIAAARDEEKSRWATELTKSVDTVRRVRQELTASERAREALKRNVEELTQTIVGVRQQMNTQQESAKQQVVHADSLVAQLNAENTAARDEAQRLRAEHDELRRIAAERETEWGDKLAKAIEGLEADHQREIDDREKKLADVQRALENERGLREQVAELARELQQQLNQTAAAHGETHRAMDQELAAREQAIAHAEELQRTLNEERATRQLLEAKLRAIEGHLNERSQSLDTERAAREQIAAIAAAHENELTKVRSELSQREAEWNARMQNALATLTAEYRETLAREATKRESALDEATRLQIKVGDLKQAFDAARSVGAEKARQAAAALEAVSADHQAALEREAVKREAALDEATRLQGKVWELKEAFDAARSAAEKKARAASVAMEEVSAERDEARRLFAELQQSVDRERAEWNEKVQQIVAGMTADHETTRANFQQTLDGERAGWDEQRQQIVGGLTADHEGAIGRAIEEREGMVRSEWQQMLDRERAEWNDKLQKIVSGMAADHENDIGKAIEERETARADSRSATQRINELQHMVERFHTEHQTATNRINELQQTLERERGEWNEKLQKVVAGITADHENDIGEALMQREAAKAELRQLTSRFQELQRKVDEAKASVVDETAIRQKIDAEWSEKLQTIVSHLASDHDEDIGKAVEQKEEARAEARTQTMRVASLQQQVERDRQMFLAAEQKWSSMRDSMTAKLHAAEAEVDRWRRVEAQPMPVPPASPQPEPFAATMLPAPDPFPSPFATIQASEIDPERARADVLDFAEQAHAVLKRSIAGSVTVPRDARRALILFVHHDPNMRTMWRDQLHKHGYDVITAADGLEGLRVATLQVPAVVIADAQMPKMDGRELCRMLKSNEQTASAKVVLMSGVYGEESPAEGFPPDEILRKPVKFDALQAALTSLLEPAV